jgi:hypothetical protein
MLEKRGPLTRDGWKSRVGHPDVSSSVGREGKLPLYTRTRAEPD